jgi:hypothetical protein
VLSHKGVDLYYVADAVGGVIAVHLVLEDGADPGVCRRVEQSVSDAFGVKARVTRIARDVVSRAMDRKLKPGVLRAEDLELVLAGGGVT